MIEAYLADPCGTLSIPYYKMIRMQMPPQLRVVHDRAFDGALDPGETHRRYFRLLHTLSRLETPLLPPDYALRRIDERHSPQLASLLGSCYPGKWDAVAALGLLRDPFAYAPLNIGAYTSDGILVGCCLGAFDAQCREETIEWLAVHPAHRRRGLACALVNTCLKALAGVAGFAAVSGEMDNPSHPLAVYRRCGFTGNDVWHVIHTEK